VTVDRRGNASNQVSTTHWRSQHENTHGFDLSVSSHPTLDARRRRLFCSTHEQFRERGSEISRRMNDRNQRAVPKICRHLDGQQFGDRVRAPPRPETEWCRHCFVLRKTSLRRVVDGSLGNPLRHATSMLDSRRAGRSAWSLKRARAAHNCFRPVMSATTRSKSQSALRARYTMQRHWRPDRANSKAQYLAAFDLAPTAGCRLTPRKTLRQVSAESGVRDVQFTPIAVAGECAIFLAVSR
jgi:hypothetical protein